MSRFILLLACLLSASASAKNLYPITFYTDWKAQAEHGGFYQAVALGLYEKHGLKVTLRPGGPQTDNSRLLAAGAIELGMISNGFQALNLAAKKADVKIVMASFQKDPQILMVHDAAAIKSLQDIKGHPIYVADAAIGSYWPWLKAKFGYSDAQVRKYGYSLLPWLRDPMAAQEGYLSSEPFTAAKAGAKPRIFLLADAGYPGYAAMVGASGKMIRTNPAVLKAFVAATREGWESYLKGNPAPADTLIKRDNPEMSDTLLKSARRALIEQGIVLSGDAKAMGVGAMTPARWDALYRQTAALGLYPKTLDVKTAYTLEFIR